MRFVILSTGRSGNNMLMSALGAHPRIACKGEVLGKGYYFPEIAHYWSMSDAELTACRQLQQQNSVAFLDRFVFRSRDPRKDTLGFRLLHNHQFPDGQPGLWRWLDSQRDIRIISIDRRNRLLQLLSWQTAKLTEQWLMMTPNERPLPMVDISREQLMTFVEAADAGRDAALARLSSLERIDVVYEDMVSDFNTQIGRVLDFLGVEATAVRPATLKQGGQPLRNRIRNFDALRAEMRGMPYAWMLEEGE